MIVLADPPLWIGVVGVDFTISELEEAVGGTDRYQAVLDELVAVSTATCPKTNLEEQACLIEALRRDDSSEGGICGLLFLQLFVSNCDSIVVFWG